MCLKYGKNRELSDNTVYFTPEINNVIEEVSDCRDLGVQLENNGSFDLHIENIVKKVKRLTGWVLRSFVNRTLPFMRKMWTTIIRPHLDYCSQLWSPPEGPTMDKLERLQYFFTGLIPEIRNMSYEERLKKLKITSLQRRYDRYRIFYMWKIKNGVVPNCGIFESTGSNSRQGCKFIIPKTPNNKWGRLKDRSFQVMGPRCWNSLPCDIRNSKETEFLLFKKEVDEYLETVKDQPRVGSTVHSKNGLYDIIV